MAARLVTLALVACALALPAVTHAQPHATHECATAQEPLTFGNHVVTRLSVQDTPCLHALAALYGWIADQRTPQGYDSCAHYTNPHTSTTHITCVARHKVFSAIFHPRHH